MSGTKQRRFLSICAAIIAGLALATPLRAQIDGGCGSALKPEDVAPILLRKARGMYELPAEQMVGVLDVPVTFHIVRKTDGSGGLDPTSIDDILDALDDFYWPADMRFCQPSFTRYVDNDFWYSQIDEQSEIDSLRQFGDVANTLNIYFVNEVSNEDGGLCGQGSFTSSDVQGVIIDYTCLNLNALVAHEVGHYFDLLHTHETANGVECPDGSNCGFTGDLVCDTPADFNLSDCLDENCMLKPECQDLFTLCTNFGNPYIAFYNPLLDNIMSYALRTCRTDLTPDQLARARATLVNLRPYLLGGCAGGDICGDSGDGDCFSANGTKGCDDGDCCQLVCAVDPNCCIFGWDEDCAALASQLCGSCGDPGAGNCVSGNGTPGCSDATCCATVCALDPYCCDTQWDGICADLAIANCLAPGDEPEICITATDGSNTGFLNDNTGWTGDDTAPCALADEIDEWYCYTATCTGLATASTCDSALFDTVLAVYDENQNLISCNNDAPGCDERSKVSWEAVQGEDYLIRVSLANEGIGTFFRLEIDCRPPQCGEPGTGDCFAPHATASCSDATCCEAVCALDPFCCDQNWDNACVINANLICNANPGEECLSATPIADGEHAVSTSDADGLNPADSSCGGGADTVDEWYAYTAQYDGFVTAKICALFNFPNGLPAFTLSVFADCAGDEIVCGNDNPECVFVADSARLNWLATEGETYFVRLSSPSDRTGAGTLSINAGGCGLPTAGSCFEANGSQGCENAECCAAVCALDSFCCTIWWDDDCALIADALCGCPGDFTLDGSVDVQDLLGLLGAWGPCPAPCVYDVNHDGLVNVTDLLSLLGSWGTCE